MDGASDTTEMKHETAPTRVMMVRDIAIFQTKLLADGLRDGMLVPVSLAAGVLGLLSKKPHRDPHVL